MGMPESDSNGTARSGVSATYGPYVSSSHSAPFRGSPPLIARSLRNHVTVPHHAALASSSSRLAMTSFWI